jgi:tetratricopeptide (TPR) repeat protein
MRLARNLGLLGLGLVLSLSGSGCDRIRALKDQLLSSSKPASGESPELSEIRSLYDSGQYDQALQKIAAAVQQDPSFAEGFYYMGLCHLGLAGEADLKSPPSEQEVAALEGFQRALSINPRHALSSIGIGDLYARRVTAKRRKAAADDAEDPYSLALAAYEKAVTIDPKLPEGQQHYARFLERMGQLDLADKAYKASIEAAATVPEIAPDYYLAYGKFLAGPADRLEEALEQFRLALVFRPGDASVEQEMAIVHSTIGMRHLEKQEYLLAEESLKEAESLFPDKSIPEARKTEDALKQLRSIRRR